MKKELNYSFRIYYKDGQSKVFGGKAVAPIYLYNDFDGLINYEEYEKLKEQENTLTTHDILLVAKKAYKKLLKDCNKLEIINIKTNEIVDFIDY